MIRPKTDPRPLTWRQLTKSYDEAERAIARVYATPRLPDDTTRALQLVLRDMRRTLARAGLRPAKHLWTDE